MVSIKKRFGVLYWKHVFFNKYVPKPRFLRRHYFLSFYKEIFFIKREQNHRWPDVIYINNDSIKLGVHKN